MMRYLDSRVNRFPKPQTYINLLTKIRADARRRLGFTIIRYRTTQLTKLKPVLARLHNTGLIIGVSNRYSLQNMTILCLAHACMDGRPIRRAELVMRSNIKFNRCIAFKQIRRLLLWGHGADLLLATSHGVVTAEYCIENRLGGRILGSIRG